VPVVVFEECCGGPTAVSRHRKGFPHGGPQRSPGRLLSRLGDRGMRPRPRMEGRGPDAGAQGSGFVGAAIRGDAQTIEQLAGEWSQLSEAPCNGLPFTRPEWVKAYLHNYDDPPFVALTARRDGRLSALLPLFEQKEKVLRLPIRMLLAPSGFTLWPTDVLVSEEATRRAATAALWGALRRMPGWDVLEIPNVPAGGAAEDLLAAAREDGFPTMRWEYMHSPIISLRDRGAVDDPLQIPRSQNLRKSIRRALRKAHEAGGLQTLHFTEADPAILHRLYDLEAASWKGEAGTAILSRAKDRVFVDAIASAAQSGGYLSIHALEVGGALVAVLLGFSYRRRFFALKLGIDESLKSLSLGHLMVYSVVAHCLCGGIDEIELMGLQSDWKKQWTGGVRPHAHCYVFNGRICGRLMRLQWKRDIRQTERGFSSHRERLSSDAPHAESDGLG